MNENTANSSERKKPAVQNNIQEQDIGQLLKVRREKLTALQQEGKDPFRLTKYDVTNHSSEIKANFEAFDSKIVSVAGRMMSKRVMGKASFCNVQDSQGSIQAYVARDNVGEESYRDFKKYDIGDIIGIKGTVFKTKTGEISIHVTEITLTSRKISRPYKYGSSLSSAVYRPYYEFGCKGYIYKAFKDNRSYQEISIFSELFGGGNSYTCK